MRALRHILVVSVLLVGVLVGTFAMPTQALANSAPGIGAEQSTPLFSSDMPFQMDLLSPSTESAEGTLFACALPDRPQRGEPALAGVQKEALNRALLFGVAGAVVSQDEMLNLKKVFDVQRAVLESDLGKEDKAAVLRAVEGGPNAGGKRYAKLSTTMNGAVIKAYGFEDAEIKELMKNKRLRAMVNPAPVEISEIRKFIPASCAFLDSDIQIETPGIGEMIKSPGPFMVKTGLYMVAVPFEVLFEAAAPIAYRYSFFTPHSERGESMFNMPDLKGADAQLGFDKALATDPEAQMERGGWLNLAVWMRAFISGFYILLIVVGAFMYMMRGSVRGKLNVLHMMPLVLLSALAMAATPVLIGYGITASNLVVSEIFSMPDTCTNAAGASQACMPEQERVNMLVNSGPAAGDDSIKDYVFKVASLASSSVFLLVMAIIALLRQLALIVVVIASPLACFAIINRSWHVHVFAWVRITLAVVFLPVLMAVILKIGLMLNPITGKMVPGWTPADESLGALFLGLLIMLATFFFMVKIPSMLAKGVIPKRLGRSGGGGVGRMASLLAMRVGGPVGMAVGAAGMLANRGGGDNALTTRNSAPGTPTPGIGMGASRRGLGVGIGAGAPQGVQADAGAPQATLDPASGQPNAAAAGQAAGAAGQATGQAADAAGRRGQAGAVGAIPEAGSAATASVAAPGANITAGSNHASGGGMQRQEITRHEYDQALTEQRQAVQAASETGEQIAPSEWLPVQEDGTYYLEYNEGYGAEMHALGAVATESAGEEAEAPMAAVGARSGRAMEHATAAAAAAVEAGNAAAEETESVHGSSAPIVMGRSSATLEGGGSVADMAGEFGEGPGPAQTAFARDAGPGDADDGSEPPMGAAPNVALPELGDFDSPSSEVVSAWAPPPVPSADVDLDDMFGEAPSLLHAEGASVVGAVEGASVVSGDTPEVAAPHLDMGDMVLPDGAIAADVGDSGAAIADQVSTSLGAVLDAHHERSDALVDAIDTASERISDATAAHGLSIANSGERAAQQFHEATEGISDSMGDMRNSSDRLRESMSTIAEEYSHSAEVMADGTRAFSERADEVSHLLQGNNNEMFTQLSRLSEVMSGRYGEINERVASLSMGVSDLRTDDLPAIMEELGRSRGELDQMFGFVESGLSEHRSAVTELVPRIGTKVNGAMDDMGEQLRRGIATIDELTERIGQLNH